jgi:hypothetical protein
VGKTSVGSQQISLPGNFWARVTPPDTVTVNRVHLRVPSGANSLISYSVALFSNSASFTPEYRISSIVTTQFQGDGLNTCAIPPQTLEGGTTYWVGVRCEGCTTTYFSYDDTPWPNYLTRWLPDAPPTYYILPDDPASLGGASYLRQMDIYLDSCN